jgi:hypothetical protein
MSLICKAEELTVLDFLFLSFLTALNLAKNSIILGSSIEVGLEQNLFLELNRI